MIEIRQTEEVKRWLKGLKDKIAKAKILTRMERMKDGNFGDAEPIGDGFSELRVHQGKGYRVYFANRNNEIILLLCGGDKTTQQADIKKAKQIAKEWGF
ncbi:TPA: type II toxin-antitoxin system RelE/ParE family toxin [Morganella morganii]|nr:type II toxin-antitoxin system RelE/ParE family toxin [Morganella morganii]